MKKLLYLFAASLLAFTSCSKDDNDSSNLSISSVSKPNQICTELMPLHSDNQTSKSNIAILNSSRWTTGQTIRVKFLNGSSFLQEKVKGYADIWTSYANINFQYVSLNENADVKIAFEWNNDTGSWSHIGKNCQQIPQNAPTINFGWFDNDTSESEFKKTILHEFGHVLGLIHEHNSPVGNIPWDKPKVYEYYQRTQGWSIAQVDTNIFKRYSEIQTNYSSYDNESIMHYPIDALLTTNGYSVGINADVSFLDIHTINNWYPYYLKSIVESGERIDIIPWKNRITSPNGQFSLEFFNGMLHIIDNKNNLIKWRAGNPFYRISNSCYLESNGNLMIKGKESVIGSSKITFSSNTTSYSGAKLYLQDDGNLVLFYNGVAKWSSKSDQL